MALAYGLLRGVARCRAGALWRAPLVYNHVACRPSTSGVINHIDHIRLDTEEDARALINHLKPKERTLLRELLTADAQREGGIDGTTTKILDDGRLTYAETKQLFLFNTLPFVGFGILDNMIMILAGEYIDQSLGAMLAISTMAAAALGNIISDVAGVGLAHYVEALVSRVGIRHPVLSAAQLEAPRARFTINSARAFGLIVGCLIGMFPLLFFDSS